MQEFPGSLNPKILLVSPLVNQTNTEIKLLMSRKGIVKLLHRI